MATVPRHLVDDERSGAFPEVEPRDAATLIVLDRGDAQPKVLLGKRHARHIFMPGKFVFPGGRVDATDRGMPAAKPCHSEVERKLLTETRFNSSADAQALILAAIRETFEETGLVIGARHSTTLEIPPGPWSKFVQTGFYPDPSRLHFIARAITPLGFPRRFDARFFCVDRGAIGHKLDNVTHSEAELVELVWLPIGEAKRLDLPLITGLVLEELEQRLRGDLGPHLPVPFYATRDGEFTRELID
jgi:8-oxo-dGTP pyrophosphatase MutT (NUDIX family)